MIFCALADDVIVGEDGAVSINDKSGADAVLAWLRAARHTAAEESFQQIIARIAWPNGDGGPAPLRTCVVDTFTTDGPTLLASSAKFGRLRDRVTAATGRCVNRARLIVLDAPVMLAPASTQTRATDHQRS